MFVRCKFKFLCLILQSGLFYVNNVRIINKQNKYPVLLLTQGENSGYEEYQDPRTWSINNGVLFAEMSGLLGEKEEELINH